MLPLGGPAFGRWPINWQPEVRSPRPLCLLSAREPLAQCTMVYPIRRRPARRLSQSTKASGTNLAQGSARAASASWASLTLLLHWLTDRSFAASVFFQPEDTGRRGPRCLPEGRTRWPRCSAGLSCRQPQSQLFCGTLAGVDPPQVHRQASGQSDDRLLAGRAIGLLQHLLPLQ